MNSPTEIPSATVIRSRLTTGSALPPRVRYTALLLAGIAMAAITGALAVTEPNLPVRTRASLVVMCLIGCAWAGFAGYVLSRREVLFVRHRVVAGWMSVVFSAVLTIAFAAFAWLGHVGWPATAVGAVMLLLAVLMLRRAQREVRRLMQRRDALQATLRAKQEAT